MERMFGFKYIMKQLFCKNVLSRNGEFSFFYRHREPQFLTEEYFVLEHTQKSFPFPKIILFHMLIHRLISMNTVSGLLNNGQCLQWGKWVGVFPSAKFSCTQILLHKCSQEFLLTLFHLRLIQAGKFCCSCKHQKAKRCSVVLSL